MQNVLVYQSSPAPEEVWTATDWPTQNSPATGNTRESAEDAWLALMSVERATVRFFGPILTTAYISTANTPGMVTVYANADHLYAVERSTEEEAREAFIAMWNAEYVATFGGQEVTDENIDWNYE